MVSKDRRSETSAKNLGEHLQEPLDPEGATVLSFRAPNPLVERLDAARGKKSRSEWLRELVERELTARATVGT